MMKPSQSGFCLPLLGIPFVAIALVLAAGGVACAQALPAAEAAPISTGFALPTNLGSLQYAVSASQSLNWGYYSSSGASASTNITGDLAYLSNSNRHPFSLVLSGGRSWSGSGQSSYSFANLSASQVANFGRWNFVVSDSVNYLPGTPVAGLSGVPGLGDLGVTPVQAGSDGGQGILTNYSSRITNSVAATLSRQLNGKTSVNLSGTYGIYRFLSTTSASANSSGAGLDSSSEGGSVGVNRQLSPRTSFGGSYSYSISNYPNNSLGIVAPGFASQSLDAFASHQFTHRLSGSISIGPQWTSVSTPGTSSSSLHVSTSGSASASYSAKNYSANVSFSRSSNSGFGVVGGAVSNSATLGVSRTFARVWSTSATAGYTQSSNLSGVGVAAFSVNTYVVGAQISRAVARSLSCYASYTLQDQSSPSTAAVNAFSGTSNAVGFGITYSPSALHLGRQ
jgi:hypothetical protein